MRRKILISIISVIMFFTMNKTTYATIEIIPNTNATGADAMVNTSITNSYLVCRQMTEKGNTLSGATVVPHLATNKDWGAVAYLSNSFYGTNTAGGNTGIEVEINGVKHYSTTTNITGVMNFGSNPNTTMRTQTSGLLLGYDATTHTNANVTELWNNRETRFVDIIGFADNYHLGMATKETNSWYSGNWTAGDNYMQYHRPVSIREGLFKGSIRRSLLCISMVFWSSSRKRNFPSGNME